MPEKNHHLPLQQQRLKLLIEQTRYASQMGILTAISCFCVFASYNYSQLLLGWLLLTLSASFSSMGLRSYYNVKIEKHKDIQFWLTRHNIIGIYAGIAWGLLALLPADDFPISYQSLFLIIPAIIGTTAISSYAIELANYRNFLIALFSSLLISHSISTGLHALPSYLIFSIIGILLYITAKRYNQSLINAIEAKENIATTAHKLALANEHLAKQQDLISQEDDIARHVFAQLTLASKNNSYGIHTWNQAMGNLSGDLIQIAQGPKEQTYILLGDFTGHGLPAALGAVPTSAVFNATASKGLPISTIASELNRKLHDLLPTGYFCCAAILELSKNRLQLKAWNGGLPPLIIRQGSNGRVSHVKSENLPLGVVGEDEFSYRYSEWTLKPGDSIYIYSDGLTEAENIDGEMWGRERLSAFLKRLDLKTPRLESLKEEIMAFTHLAPISDDISVVEIETAPTEAASNLV